MAKKHKRKQPDADEPGQASIKLTRKEFETGTLPSCRSS